MGWGGVGEWEWACPMKGKAQQFTGRQAEDRAPLHT